MKKIFIFLLFILLQFQTPIFANVSVKNIGDTIISANQISKQIQIQEDSFITLQFSIKARALCNLTTGFICTDTLIILA